MTKKIAIEKRISTRGVFFRIMRFHWPNEYGNPKDIDSVKIDILFIINFGYWLRFERQAYGLNFYIDALRFNIDESTHRLKGFFVPLIKYVIL